MVFGKLPFFTALRALDRMQSAYGLVSNVGGIDNSKKQKEQELEENTGSPGEPNPGGKVV